MQIFIDGDSSGKRLATIRIAKKRHVPVHIYCDTSHDIEDDYATVHIVDKSPNSADLNILNHIQPNDIVITNDVGLATLALSKRAIPIHNSGRIFTDDNIEYFLYHVYKQKQIRFKNGRRNVKGFKKRNNENLSFNKSLHFAISKAQKEEKKNS